MIAADREWQGTDGASPELLGRLRKVMPAGLPSEYFQLLAFSNGGEGDLPMQPNNFCLDDGEFAAEQYVNKVFDEFFSASSYLAATAKARRLLSICGGRNPGPLWRST